MHAPVPVRFTTMQQFDRAATVSRASHCVSCDHSPILLRKIIKKIRSIRVQNRQDLTNCHIGCKFASQSFFTINVEVYLLYRETVPLNVMLTAFICSCKAIAHFSDL